jgi:hypothetical protein
MSRSRLASEPNSCRPGCTRLRKEKKTPDPFPAANRQARVSASLPFRRLRRSAFITMMQAANLRDRYYSTRRRLLHHSRLGRVLPQRQVRARLVIIGQKTFQVPQQRCFIENDQMVQALPSNGPNRPLDVRPLLRDARRAQHFPDTQILQLFGELATEDPVTVMQQILRPAVPRKCLPQCWAVHSAVG